MLKGLLILFQVFDIDGRGRICRNAFRRRSGFAFARPAMVLHGGIAGRRSCRSFRIIIDRVSFDQRRIMR
jgi:hypothetical protein